MLVAMKSHQLSSMGEICQEILMKMHRWIQMMEVEAKELEKNGQVKRVIQMLGFMWMIQLSFQRV